MSEINTLEIPMEIEENSEIPMEVEPVYQTGGTDDYEKLKNLPSINDVELIGNKSLGDLGIVNNVQPDWEQDDTEAEDYIKNKPTDLADFNEDADHRIVTDDEK